MDESLENEFWKDIKQQCRFMCICSRKGGGKSHLLTNFLAISLCYDLYEEYHLVIPELHTDNNDDTYKFIKNNSKCIVYESFQPHLIAEIKEISKSKKICFCMDDSTNFMFSNKHSADLLHLLSTTRHGKGCQVIIVTHALKNILSVAVRGLIDHLFVGSFTNYNLIKTNLYEENCSLLMTMQEFIDDYKQFIIGEDYNFLYLNIKCHSDFHVNKWNLSKFDRKNVRPNGKCKVKKLDKDYQTKQKIITQNRTMLLKKSITKKPKNDIFNLKILK